MSAFVLAALLSLAAQDLQVRAELVPGATIRAGEPVVLRVTAESRGRRPDIRAPTLPDGFNVIGTSDQTATSLVVPGGRTFSLIREYVLVPARTGTFTIPPISVEADGIIQSTPALQIRVIASLTAPTVRDAVLRAYLQPDTVFVGQQATLIGEILVTPDLQMRLARPPEYEMPSPSEFWIQELQPEPQTEGLIRDGERFNAQRFARAYFPLTPGKFSFAPIRVTYEARQGFVFAPQTVELRSESPRVVVLPLPTEGRPESFRGAVGRFSLSSILDARNASVGDGVTLSLLVQGEGNVKALPPPLLPPIAHVSVLEPSELADVRPRGRSVQGSKRFSWVLVPERAGRIEIPAIAYTYFDPYARRYVTQQTSPLSFEVSPAGAVPASSITSALRPRPGRDPLEFTRSRTFAALQLLPVLLVAGAWYSRRRPRGPSRKIWREWKYRAQTLSSRADFSSAADRLLRDALFAVAPEQVFRAGSVPEIDPVARRLLPVAVADEVLALLGRLGDARYSNTHLAPDERAQISERVRDVLNELWQQLRIRMRASALPVIALLALQVPAPEQLFDRGVQAYEQRDFAAAADHFARYTTARPHDANGWYNLGIAQQATRQPARAAWALLQAAELQPNSVEISAQLGRAGVQQLARRVRPATGLTTSGTLLAIAALWWLACLVAAAGILFRRKVLAALALLPLAAAGILVTVTLIERALPPAGIVLDQAANLYVGRSLHAETLRQLQPLAGVSIIEQADGWLRVRTLDGEMGWVREDLIGKL